MAKQSKRYTKRSNSFNNLLASFDPDKPVLFVESPAKAKTIYNYLGGQYNVFATMGHLIDLPKNKLGVDINNNFEPQYVDIKGKKKLVNQIKKIVSQAKQVFLAQDPDREGEAIAWQVANLGNLKAENFKDSKFKRIVFHEITKPAILDAVKHPREIDYDLVEAQKARRILDRLVGYPLSELLWHKIRYGLSAGRVQSAALRLIVERQQEIDNFKPEVLYYLGIKTDINDFWVVNKNNFVKYKIKKQELKDFKQALENLKQVKVSFVKKVVEKQAPPPPLTTSSLQQVANKLHGFSAKTTMRIAQELYQGMDIPKLGRKALITYMRTDSVKISQTAINSIRDFITKNFGSHKLNPTIRVYKTKVKLAQEAHEAIRPVYINITPEQLKGLIPDTHYKLYKLIWLRTVATQFKPAEYTTIKIGLDVNLPKQKILGIKESILSKPGFKELYGVKSDKDNKENSADKENQSSYKKLLNIKQGDILQIKKILQEEFKTKPPLPYTDASLVKTLEKLGIGRPSTFATIIDTLIRRNYVERKNKYLIPTDTGKIVLKFLKEHFNNIVDYGFTANMENKLDEIASGKEDRVKFLKDFYPSFIKQIQEKEKQVQKQDLVVLEKTDKKCPICGANMVLKLGKYGKFYSCSRFPDCNGMLPYIDEDKYLIPEKAKTGEWVLKVGPYGKFWAHKDYPKVKETAPLLLKETCPLCGAHLVERKSKKGRVFIGCSSYPNCKYIKKD